MANYSDLSTLAITLQEGILHITIQRPEVLNALNQQVLQDISRAFHLLDADAEVQSVIITGSGHKAFAAGADISEIQALDAAQAEAFSRNGHSIFNQIEQCRKPVIAAVNGFALGGGCELAMACHLRVAAENAKFGQPEVNLGLIAGYGGTQRLPRLIGRGKALELLLTSDMLTATQALELGLVNYVVTQQELIEKATEILKKIMSKSPYAIAETIRAVNAAGTDAGYTAEAEAFKNTAASQDGKEGTAAFLEKRAANFKKLS
jgi:enoyl-CoA hydratase